MTVSPISSAGPNGAVRPSIQRLSFSSFPSSPFVAGSLSDDGSESVDGVLELADGSAYRGISFGADGKSISGECVFQTGLDFLARFINVGDLKL
jgi:carbamoyl-phosphate synthase/aspartate carbamoyltransferase